MLSRKWGNFSIFAQDFQEGTQLYVLMSGQKASDHCLRRGFSHRC